MNFEPIARGGNGKRRSVQPLAGAESEVRAMRVSHGSDESHGSRAF